MKRYTTTAANATAISIKTILDRFSNITIMVLEYIKKAGSPKQVWPKPRELYIYFMRVISETCPLFSSENIDSKKKGKNEG